MGTTLLILLNKLVTMVCKMFKKQASVYPGSIVLPFNHHILDKLKYPELVICVTGSSGKGSTTSLLAHILSDNGYKVVWNSSGSNHENAVTTLLLNNTNAFTHKVNADCVLLEMDESYLRVAFKKNQFTHIVITNVTRDQVARNGAPEIVLKKLINQTLDTNAHLIINADDPLVNQFTLHHKGPITTYGLAKNKYSLTKPINHNVDGAYCPVCHTKLKYTCYHYGHLGVYACPKNDFQRKTDYEAKNIDLEKSQMQINDQKIHLNKNVFFAAYYTLAAYTLCKTIGMKEKDILKSINVNILPSKRGKILKLDDREINMLESKNENNLSYYQSLKYINQHPDTKTIILGFDNVSRRYKYNDLSWIYDIDFEMIDTSKVSRIFVIGRFRFDVAARLINAGLDEDKILLVEEIGDIKTLLRENSSGTIFTMVCFDMTEILKKLLLAGDEDEN